MPMMHVGRMGMRVSRWLMLMPVAVRTLHGLHILMAVTVIVIVMSFVVLMRMLVLQRDMGVLVAVAFHQM